MPDKAKIIIVEDESVIAMDIKRTLQKLGYQVLDSFSSGESAISEIPKKKPDLILMDIKLAGQIDGIETAELIKQKIDIPIIFLTAHSEINFIQRAKLIKPYGYLIKPMQERELFSMIEISLHTHKLETKVKLANLQLAEQRQQLEDLVYERTRKLTLSINRLQNEIFQRQAVEKQLRDSEQRFRATFDQAAVGIAHLAPNGKWLKVNQKLCDILEYSQEELINLTFQDITYPDDLESILYQLKRVLNNEIRTSSLEKRYIKKDGAMLWVNLTLSLVKDGSGQAKYFISVIEDISNKKQNEIELFHYQSNLEKMIAGRTEQLNDVIVNLERINLRLQSLTLCRETVINADNETMLLDSICEIIINVVKYPLVWIGYKEHNPAKNVRIMSYKGFKEEYIQDLNISWGDDVRAKGPVGRSIQENRYQCFNILHDDFKPWQEQAEKQGFKTVLAVPIRFRQEVIGVIAVYSSNEDIFDEEEIRFFEDISNDVSLGIHSIRNHEQRLQSEKDLFVAKEEAEKANRLKSEFLANMSHEIRTPLNAVLGFAEILSKEINHRPHLEFIHNIEASGKTLLNLINDILDLSKIEAGKLKIALRSFNPREVINELAAMFEQKISAKGLRFYSDIDAKLPGSIILDESRLRQILLNLLSNAVKFTSQGYVKVTAQCRFLAHDNCQFELILSVEDTGIGIAENQQNLVFEPFEQQESQDSKFHGGTGLGLAITKRLVELLHGRISLKSKLNQGSTFTISFKDVQQGKELQSYSEVEQDPDMNNIVFYGQSVLIVDDIKINRKLLQKFLANHELTLIEAENGLDALNLARQYRPIVILMDMKMPVMNGYKATELIKNDPSLSSIIVIAVTASAIKQRAEKIHQLCDDVLTKPINKQDLIQKLSQYLKFDSVKPKFSQSKKSSETADYYPIDSMPSNCRTELITILESEYEPVWENLNDTIIVDDLIAFANNMQTLSQKYACPYFRQWTDQLYAQTEIFDMKKLPDTIGEFAVILTRLKQEY